MIGQEIVVLSSNISGSSLTQIWQVGPNIKEPDATRTIFLPQLTFHIESETSRSARKIHLASGVYSFFQDGDAIAYQKGIDSRAQFELNIHKSGTFFVETSKEGIAQLNGKRIAWARLRKGDRIKLGHEVLTCKQVNFLSEEETVLEIPTRLTASKKLEKLGFKKHRFFSFRKQILLLTAALALCSLVAYLRYEVANLSEEKIPSIEHSQYSLEPIGFTAVTAEVEKTTWKESKNVAHEFIEEDYVAIVERFRKGEKRSACLQMRQALSAQKKRDIWTQKAQFFLDRRCEKIIN